MKIFATVLCTSLLVLANASPAYKYQAPLPAKQIQNVVNLRPQQQVSNGIYSSVQAPPLVQFNSASQVVPQTNYGSASIQPQQQNTVTSQVVSSPTVVSQPASIQLPQQNEQQSFFVNQQQPLQQTVQTVQTVQPVQQIVPQQQQQTFVQQPIVQPQQVTYQQQVQAAPQVTQQYNQVQVPQTIVTKDIYIHSAPDETEEVAVGKEVDSNIPVRKNYRIVFIKAPTQNLKLTSTALKHVQAANEEKTVIYVLSKKPDVNEIHQQLSIAQAEPKVHKPEVYFIKYKTQEEAQRAQQEIQAQYDALGGSTRISDEGIAPVQNISGGSIKVENIALPSSSGSINNFSQSQPALQQQGFVQQNYQSQNQASSGNLNLGSAPATKYLPAKTFK